MLVLWIILAVIAFIVALILSLLFFAKFKIIIGSDSNLNVILKVSVAGVPLYSLDENDNSPKIKLSDYTPEAIQAREEQRINRKKKKTSSEKVARQKNKRSIPDTVKFIFKIVKILYQKYMPHLEIELTRIKILIGTPDAASTALLYGVATQVAAYSVEWLDSNIKLSKRSLKDINISPDFCSGKSTFDVKIILRLPIRYALGLLLRMGMRAAVDKNI